MDMTRDQGYQALSDLIQKGFLTTALDIEGKSLVLKTVNEKEYQLVRMLAGIRGEEGYDLKFNLYFLAFSLFIVDGDYVLGSREEKISTLKDFVLGFPDRFSNRILKELSEMRNKAYDALKFIEGYSYTNESRIVWRILCGNPPNLDAYTGIPGTGQIGLNVHQESWVNINRVLDTEEEHEEAFSNALFVASSNSPKGAKQVRAKHDAQLNAMEEHRKNLSLIGYAEAKQWRPEGWAASVDTAEELVAELERQMSGVKDKHDIFMENYFKKMREKAEAKALAIKKHIEENRKDVPDFDGYSRPLTPEETKNLITNRKSTKTIRVQSDEAVSPQDRERFLSKVGSKILTGKVR